MKLKANKSYYFDAVNVPHGRKIHVDYIVNNPTDPDCEDCKLIVFRYWSKYKQRWIWEVEPYWVLCIYNKWRYKINT